MSRINTNVSSLLSQRVLGQQNRSLNTSLERLSTGLRINRGADDPAGLIASESLRAQKTSISAAIGNAERAEQVVSVAEGGLEEVNNLLLEVQSLVVQSANEAGLSLEEKEANQLQIDSILQTIDRISETTSFQGTKLLNGNFDFLVSADPFFDEVTVNAAKVAPGTTQDIDLTITEGARDGTILLSAAGSAAISTSGGRVFSFTLAGDEGSADFAFADGTSLSDIADEVEAYAAITGVNAFYQPFDNTVTFSSFDTYDGKFVSLDVTDAAGVDGAVTKVEYSDQPLTVANSYTDRTALNALTGEFRDEAADYKATINGAVASVNGYTASISSEFLDVTLDLNLNGTTLAGETYTASIKGGGATFNLGESVDIGSQVTLGIGSVATRELGNPWDGLLSELASGQGLNVLDGDLTRAQDVVDSAITRVSQLRGRLGAFQRYTVGSSIRSLGVALENTSAAESAIRDTDFAAETAALTRAQILQQAAANSLGIANSQPQSALALLG